MNVLIIRHAQSSNNALQDLGRVRERVEDPEISDLGVEQAHRLGRLLASLPAGTEGGRRETAWRPELLCTSLMLRAARTAEILAERLGVPLEGWVDLHEVGGVYLDEPGTGRKRSRPGAGRDVLARRFPGLSLPDGAGPEGWWNQPFESGPAAAAERAERVARKVFELCAAEAEAPRTLGLITHGDFSGYLLHRLLRIPGGPAFRVKMNNTGCTLLDVGAVDTKLVFHNWQTHLPFELMS